MAQVQTEILENRQARLVVEVEAAGVQKEMKAAARRIARKVNIPGFRKGKAPYNVIRQYYGDAAILDEAMENIVQAAYSNAIDEAEIEPYAPGNLEDVSFDPMVLTFTIPLAPETRLGAYRSVRVDYEAPKLEDSEIDEALEDLRERQAEMEPAERELAFGDVAEMDIVARLTDAEEDADPWIEREEVRIMINEDATYPLPGFPQEVVGMRAGDERSFEIAVKEDEDIPDDMRGKTVAFEVSCKTVMDFKLPELTDEFAQSLGDYATVEDLRKELIEVRTNQIEQEARDAYLEAIFTELEDMVEVDYPEAMLEHEVEQRIEEFDSRLKQSGLTLEDYKKINEVDDETLFEDFKPEAAKRLKRGLILTELVEEEQLSVSDDEVEDEIATLTLSFGTEAAMARQFFLGDEAKRSIRNQLMTDKALDRLIAIAKGEAPEIGAEPTNDGQADVDTEETDDTDESEEVEPSAVEETEEATDDAIVETIEASVEEDSKPTE